MATATDQRLLDVTLASFDDVVLTGFSGGEAMSRLFSYQLELEAPDDIDAKKVLFKPVTWKVQYTTGKPRFFNGIISRFSAGTRGMRDVRPYRAEVVPLLWFLTRGSDCRIFQNLAVPDILRQVFKDFNLSEGKDFSMKFKRTYPKREYCVQYRETAFNFVSRLMEHEGIFYFFTHDDGKHVLVLGDDAGLAYADCPEKSPVLGTVRQGPGIISSWEHQFAYRTGNWTQTDYNFETPRTNLLTTSKTVISWDGGNTFEFFDYPGEYPAKPVGTDETKFRMEEEELSFDVVTGNGGCTTFSPGLKFSIQGADVKAEKGKTYVLTAVQHVATDYSSDNTTRRPQYSNSFTCVDAKVAFRPTRLTIKPAVQGPQTAVVVGPKGQEIFTDKFGRIKVQFFWDRRGKSDENSSCFIRVAQVWAGKRWGASFWPRIGQEVVVDFLEGDPDRPLVVGSVYNADQMPPYQGDGPDSKHASDNKVCGVKSNTTKGGEGYNEWRFDDTKGQEQIFIHGQRNMDVRVINDRITNIGPNDNLTVGGEKDGKKSGDLKEKTFQDHHVHTLRNRIEHIEGNWQFLVGKGGADDPGKVDISIEKDQKELIGGNYDLHVKGNLTAGVDGNENLTVGGDKLEAVKGKNHLHVTGDSMEKVDGGLSITVGGDQQTKTGGKANVDAAQEIHLKAGQKVILEASTMISLVVGGNYITIDSSGVSIFGTMVNINSGGSAGSGSGSSPTAPQDASAAQDAQDAQPTDPDQADDSKSGLKSCP